MIKCFVIDIKMKDGDIGKAYVNADLVSAIVDTSPSSCTIFCGELHFRVDKSSKEVIEMIRNAEAGSVL